MSRGLGDVYKRQGQFGKGGQIGLIIGIIASVVVFYAASFAMSAREKKKAAVEAK